MSIFEYNKEEEERKLRKAEYEAVREEGIKEGIKVGMKEGIEVGKKETAVVMNKMKFPVEKIAEVLQVDKDVIVKWIEDK